MAHISNSNLKDELRDTLKGDANYRSAANSANIDLVDSLYHTEVVSLTFTSASGTQTFPVLKLPASSIITEYGIMITSQSSRDSSLAGYRIGTTAGGTDLVTTSTNGIQGSGTVMNAGTGSFSVASLTTASNGGAIITATPGTLYRSAATDIYVQISASAGGFITGQASAYVTYVKL
jgi:hypothetical protein